VLLHIIAPEVIRPPDRSSAQSAAQLPAQEKICMYIWVQLAVLLYRFAKNLQKKEKINEKAWKEVRTLPGTSGKIKYFLLWLF
jgi:hypothetical protein